MESLIRQARDAGHEPRVHGNGFIQLDLDASRRLHFWGHPQIPTQAVYTPIHDHIFDFDSRVLKGEIVNVVYSFVPMIPEWRVWEAVNRGGDNTELLQTEAVGRLEIQRLRHIEHGGSYWMPKGTFHETITPQPAITLLFKHGQTLAQNPMGPRPRVLIRDGSEPDNTFNRHEWHVPALWQIIEEIEDAS